MSVMSNPLVAPRVDSTKIYSGIFIAEDIETLYKGIKSGDWVDAAVGGIAGTLDALALYVDPASQVAANGFAWLIEHVKPLSDALEAVAGDADQITAYAQTWKNAANAVNQAGVDLRSAVDRETIDWTGPAANAYRDHITGQLGAIQSFKECCNAASEMVTAVGLMVSFARGFIRDLVAQCLASLFVRIPEWCAELGITLGLATPVVVAQAASFIAQWVARIGRVLRGVVKSIQKLMPVIRRLHELLQALSDAVKKLARKLPHEPHGGVHEGSGPHLGETPHLGEAPHRTPDDIDRIIEGIREESTPQSGETVHGGTGAKGTLGEQNMGFAYSEKEGWAFLEGPSGTQGHASNAAGFDGVAFKTDGPPEIHILDNKSLAREGNVSSATAITDNLEKNLDALAQRAADPRFNDVPRIQELRDSIQQARDAVASGAPLPPNVHLVVTNVAGQSTGVTARLASQGVEFRDLH